METGNGEDGGAEQMPGWGRHLADAWGSLPRPWRKQGWWKLPTVLHSWLKGTKESAVRAGTETEACSKGQLCRLAKEHLGAGGHLLPFLSPRSLQACCFHVSAVLSLFPPVVELYSWGQQRRIPSPRVKIGWQVGDGQWASIWTHMW